MRRVFASTHPFGHLDPAPRDLVRQAGGALELNPYARKLTPAELRALLPGAEVVIASTERYTAELLDAAPGLRLIARTGVGLDGIDLELCRARGIRVSWTPDGPSDSVAELTLGLILSLVREVPQADRAIRAGGWTRRTGWLLQERRVGLLGLGRCGSRVARLLRPFGCRVLGCDTDPLAQERARALGVEVVDLDQLLARSEVLSLHVPLTSETRGLFDAARLGALPRGAYLVNTARGELLDEGALLAALEAGQLAGAALDVFHEEPYRGPLAAREDVLLTAHMGSCSDAGRRAMELGAAEAVAAYLRGEPIPNRLV
ncbi:MAG: phosphoglycerate dehydrogenase [Planctomycetota bacterium]